MTSVSMARNGEKPNKNKKERKNFYNLLQVKINGSKVLQTRGKRCLDLKNLM